MFTADAVQSCTGEVFTQEWQEIQQLLILDVLIRSSVFTKVFGLAPRQSRLLSLSVCGQAFIPRSCNQQLIAFLPCASGGNYQGRPCPHGGWACSRVHCATAAQVLAGGAPR